jgi:hypothetical protein
MKVFPLKNGETFTGPSLFLNPQHPLDARAILTATTRAPGLPNIDGIVIDIVDYRDVSDNLGLDQGLLAEPSRTDARNKIRLIDPALHHLLSGTSEKKEAMLAMKLFDKRIQEPIKKLAEVPKKERTRKIIDEVYPYLIVKPLIEFEMRKGASAIIAPSVNISSGKHFTRQVAQANKMLTDTRTLLETSSLKSYGETRDLINVLTIAARLLEPQNFATLFRLALCNKPDQVGFRFLGIKESDTVTVRKMFTFLRTFAVQSMDDLDRREPIPIHLFNVDELGYAGYCSAVCNIVSPVATSPYYHYPSKDDGEDDIDTSPTFYNPIEMNQPKAHSVSRLPCTCRWCSSYVYMASVPKKFLPMFRRLHWLDCKDEEIRQFRETPARIDIALRDKFAQSMRTQLAAYIPEEPIFAVY